MHNLGLLGSAGVESETSYERLAADLTQIVLKMNIRDCIESNCFVNRLNKTIVFSKMWEYCKTDCSGRSYIQFAVNPSDMC